MEALIIAGLLTLIGGFGMSYFTEKQKDLAGKLLISEETKRRLHAELLTTQTNMIALADELYRAKKAHIMPMEPNIIIQALDPVVLRVKQSNQGFAQEIISLNLAEEAKKYIKYQQDADGSMVGTLIIYHERK